MFPGHVGVHFPTPRGPGTRLGVATDVCTRHEHEQVQFIISAKAEILKLFHWGMVTVE